MDTARQEFLKDFLLEARERADEIEQALLALPSAPADRRPEVLEVLKRGLHTLKGNAAMMGLDEIRDLAHALEDRVAALDPEAPEVGSLLAELDRCRALLNATEREGTGDGGPREEERGDQAAGDRGTAARLANSLRVPFASLDALVDRLAEVIIFRNRLREVIERSRRDAGRERRRSWEAADRAEQDLARGIEQLQQQVLELRMVPLKTLFGPLQRIVHDESAARGTRVELITRGGDTPMDKGLLEVANEALGHLVRNAVIHGVEPPEERRKRGKPEVGRVELIAAARSGEVRIAVTDDGAGVDRRRLAELAAERGLPAEDPGRLFDVLFLPGVSTHRGADISAGRGIGLAAVQEAVHRHGGRVEVESFDGSGTRFFLRLPLTVSITRALILEADGERYALPLPAVVESVRFGAGSRHEINGAGVLPWRDGVLPLLDLGVTFGTAEHPRDQGYVTVIEYDRKLRGLTVDGIAGIREIVVKGLDPLVGSPQGIAGSTVLGDGWAILILDPGGLMEISPIPEGRA